MIEKFTKLYNEGKMSEASLVKMAAFKASLLDAFTNPETYKSIATLAAGLPIAGAMGYGLSKITGSLEQASIDNKGPEYFNNMLNVRPDLKNEPEEILIKYFKSLMEFSPNVAKDPLAAAAFMRQAIQYEESAGGPPLNMFETLAKLEEKQIKNKPGITRVGSFNLSPSFGTSNF